MTGDINSFRSRFFGGFNREDVVEYIAKLAQERNELEAAKTKADNDVQALTLEIERLRGEAEGERRLLAEDRERMTNAFESAGRAFAEYDEAFKGMCAEIGAAATGVFSVLQNAGDITAKLPPMLARAAERFGALRSEFDADRPAPGPGLETWERPGYSYGDNDANIDESIDEDNVDNE